MKNGGSSILPRQLEFTASVFTKFWWYFYKFKLALLLRKASRH